MSKFVIECPSCRRYTQAGTGFFAKKKINCDCGYTIHVKTDELTSRVCPHCGNVVVFDQSESGKANCPVCNEPINTFFEKSKAEEISCAQCGVRLIVNKGASTYTCPVCDHVNEKRLETERMEAARQAKRKKNITAIGVVVMVSIIVVYMLVTKVVIPNNNYNNAVALMNSGKYEDAVNKLEALNGYKDSDSLKTTAEISIIANASIGDNVVFGNYNGNTEWIVLAKEDGKILVISKYAIERMLYHEEYTPITWEKCDLRSWLNGIYLSTAFSSGEQARIVETSISNPDNSEYGTDGGNNTNDKVFLLSIDEVNKYFTSDSAREATLSDGTSVWWWLRSPGSDSYGVADVGNDGSVFGFGYHHVYYDHGAVRPALWIDISNL